ncbi:MAG: NUDIX hydrolase [Methanomassiliicoccales archaeon]|nr:NUDIX hydrolase [Methanomassiliicoccales archaeon]
MVNEAVGGASKGDEKGNAIKGYKNPVLTVDGILMERGTLLLVRRGREPEKGKLALPGGIVEYGETTEEAVVRELREETGISTKPVRLLGVYSDPARDPRGHFITVAYVLSRESGELKAGDDAADVVFLPISDLPHLAFDHDRIVADFLREQK